MAVWAVLRKQLAIHARSSVVLDPAQLLGAIVHVDGAADSDFDWDTTAAAAYAVARRYLTRHGPE